MRKFLLVLGMMVVVTVGLAQIPTHYYDTVEGMTGHDLKAALHKVIKKGHQSISYSAIWTAYWSTDNKGEGVVWDM